MRQSPDPLDQFIDAVLGAVDTDTACSFANGLQAVERPTDFRSFGESATYIERQFREDGLHVHRYGFPADGVTRYHGWTSPVGFTTRDAVCELVEPAACRRILAGREQEPNTAVVGSGHTGPQGLVADVVRVRRASDIGGANIEGKIVYCAEEQMSPRMRNAVVAGGGLALVSSYAGDRDAHSSFVKWQNVWDSQPDGWLPTKSAASQNLPGLCISPKAGRYLESCLERGLVKLRVSVTGEYRAGELPGVFARAAGVQEEAVRFTAHAFEPGRVDNASGVGLCFAALRTIRQATLRLGFQQLPRSIAAFHSQECYGVMAWQQYDPGCVATVSSHLNVDQVGVSAQPVRMRPGLLPSSDFSPALLGRIAGKLRERFTNHGAYFDKAFSINCTILADPALGGVPTCQLEQDNPFWHSSQDRPEHVSLDRETVAFALAAASTWGLFHAAAGAPECGWLFSVLEEGMRQEVASGALRDTELYFRWKLRELESIGKLLDRSDRARFAEGCRDSVEAAQRLAGARERIEPAGNADERGRSVRTFPRARVGGPAVAGLFTRPQLEAIGPPKWSTPQLTLKAWADGSRSVYQIARLAAFELGEPVGLDYALRFFGAYAAQGLVELLPEPEPPEGDGPRGNGADWLTPW